MLMHEPVAARRSRGPLGRAVAWAFRSRQTGRIVLVQLPNLPLALFLVLRGAQVLLSPRGTAGTVLDLAGTAALAWWAVDEVLRGVNPFRRALGALVLGWLVVSLVS